MCSSDLDSFVGLDGGDSIPIIETLFPTGVDLVLVEAVACGLRSLKRSGPGWKLTGIFYAVVEFDLRVREWQRSNKSSFRDCAGNRTVVDFRSRVKAMVLYEFGIPLRRCCKEFLEGSKYACFTFEGLLSVAKGLSASTSGDRLFVIRCLLSDFRNALVEDGTWRVHGLG